ncbi:phosphotransferase family protein [Streptomyces sp. GC420]|uniref:phosphotransferase family protein n=1 Tax=Streptomyces sp. GC420 TaxID=2697568 RepID=UPI001414FD61|nr:phosphotransferase family protein [Streptomyces sp. GC420]NBM14722.1 phosphotransferase [Streptomyces sp. GC420]
MSAAHESPAASGVDGAGGRSTRAPALAPALRGLEPGALDAWFTEHVPDCTGPLTAVLVQGGRSNLTYRVSDGRYDWIVRRPPLGGLTPSAHDVMREYRVMRALWNSGVAVPQTVAVCQDDRVIGAPFTVVSYVEGRVLRHRSDTEGMTPHQLCRCADALVAELARLHAVPPESVGLGDLGRPRGYVLRQLRRWRSQWDLVATRPLPDLDRLHQALEESAPPESDEASLVHGDFRIDNTILDRHDVGRVRAVVDWELSTLGDPLADLGMFLAYRSPVVDALLGDPAATDPKFPAPLELAEQYALLSGRDLTHLSFHLALAHFKIAVIAQGVAVREAGQGPPPGCRPGGAASAVPELVRAGMETLGLGVSTT